MANPKPKNISVDISIPKTGVPPTSAAPIAKKNFSMGDFKKKSNIEEVADKAIRWVVCSDALQKATGLPGWPVGYVGLSRGFTNTGKSTSVCEGIVAAQKMGILPIIIDTENNMGHDRLKNMGFDWDNDFFIMINNNYLLEHFGLKKDKNKEEASIEDLADCVNFFLNKQKLGELPVELLIVIDSIGTLDCDAIIKAKSNDTSQNNMWNAAAYERSFKSILNYRIPNSRKTSYPFTNTLIAVQKIWIDSMGMGAVKHKGGEAFFFGARLIYHHGGIKGHGTQKVTATSKKKEVSYGIETKIIVAKNQIDCELGGISLEGKVISTPHGFIGNENVDINEYKKKYIQYFRDRLGSDIEADDIGTKFEEGEFDTDDLNEMLSKKTTNE